MSTITLSKTTSKFYDGENYPPAIPFKLVINVDGRAIGHIEAFKINRRAARGTGDFHLAVEHFSEGIYDFAKELFDQYPGNLRSEFYNGRPFQRGTGCFGKEVNDQNFIYIEEIVIEGTADRKRGYGTAALKKFHERCHTFSFIFIFPGILHGLPILSREEKYAQQDRVVNFYRKSGYRRVGNSQYFAYAQDENHASRKLLAENDAPGEPRVRAPEEMSVAFPLHCNVLLGHTDLFNIIKGSDIAQLHLPDDLGETPLHYAAGSGKFLVALCLLERSFKELFLTNIRGETPLDKLEMTIHKVEESLREQMPDFHTLVNLGKDERILNISSKPLARVLRECMEYIEGARVEGLGAEDIQSHINSSIAPEKEAFLQRLKQK